VLLLLFHTNWFCFMRVVLVALQVGAMMMENLVDINWAGKPGDMPLPT
jgi:hypothetical protein